MSVSLGGTIDVSGGHGLLTVWRLAWGRVVAHRMGRWALAWRAEDSERVRGAKALERYAAENRGGGFREADCGQEEESEAGWE